MSDDFVTGLIGFMLGCFLMFIALAVIDNSWKEDSVKRGAAEYYLDSNHKAQWRWKEAK